MATIEDLEARIQHLEYQLSLLTTLVDHRKDPLASHALAANLTEQQVQAVYGLIEKTKTAIERGHGPSRQEFERALNNVKPLQPEDGDPDERGSWDYAGGVAKCLCNVRRYAVVGEYLRKKGVTF